MERIDIELCGEKFDAAVHGPIEGQPSLPEGGDLTIYVKKNATVGGNAMAVITFTVQLPNGTLRRAQCPTTVATSSTPFQSSGGGTRAGTSSRRIP